MWFGACGIDGEPTCRMCLAKVQLLSSRSGSLVELRAYKEGPLDGTLNLIALYNLYVPLKVPI